MKELFYKAQLLNEKFNDNGLNSIIVANKLCEEYKNIPLDIMEWFFVRHSMQGEEIMKGINNFDAHRMKVVKIKLTNEELKDKDKIVFAPFAYYDEPYIIEHKETINWYRDYYFKSGTWQAPIIAIKQNNKLFVVDGTCRLHHMLICLKNKFEFIKDKHCVYVLEEK